MKIDILTLFPEMFVPVTDSSILGKAREKGILDINLINIRDFSEDKHNKADDTPFGGGPGMVMLAQPIFSALESIKAQGKKNPLYVSEGKSYRQTVYRVLCRRERDCNLVRSL